MKKYHHNYYQKNRKNILTRQKAYREKNIDKALLREKRYREEHKKEIKLAIKKWSLKNKAHISEYKKKRYNKEACMLKNKERKIKCIASWKNYIPNKTKCEICGKIIYFKGHIHKNTIHFDHKHENCSIQNIPSNWMALRYRTPKNQVIWESCDFGLLCSHCNSCLPTKNRKQWVRKVIKYVFGA